MEWLAYGPEVLAAVVRHLESCWPAEGCGMVLQAPGGPLEVHPLRNVAGDPAQAARVHAARDAHTLFVADPRDLYRVNMQEYERGARVKGIFHSHPELDAYFSPTDREWAAPGGVEQYPGAEHLVVSVKGGRAVRARAFRFDVAARVFVEREVPLTG